jgi:hypothetical protein
MRAFFYGAVLAAAMSLGCQRADPVASSDSSAASDETNPGGVRPPVATTGNRADPSASSNLPPAGSSVRREAAYREFTLPAGTQLTVALDTPIASDTSRVEQRVQAHVSRAVMVDGATVLPEGTEISGVVTDATQSAKVKGRAHVAVRFDTLAPEGADFEGAPYAIQTRAISRTAPKTTKDDAVKIGAPAAGGAIVGAIVGGKKGAAIGTAVGGGAGTAVVLSTRGEEVRLARGAALTLELSEPVTIRVKPTR